MGWFKKLKKSVKKITKSAGKLNPLIVGGKAQKQLSAAAKKGIPIVLGAGGGAAVTSAFTGIVGNTSGLDGFLSNLSGTIGKVRDAVGAFEGTPGYIPPAPDEQAPTQSNMTPLLIAGGAVALLLVMSSRKG